MYYRPQDVSRSTTSLKEVCTVPRTGTVPNGVWLGVGWYMANRWPARHPDRVRLTPVRSGAGRGSVHSSGSPGPALLITGILVGPDSATQGAGLGITNPLTCDSARYRDLHPIETGSATAIAARFAIGGLPDSDTTPVRTELRRNSHPACLSRTVRSATISGATRVPPPPPLSLLPCVLSRSVYMNMHRSINDATCTGRQGGFLRWPYSHSLAQLCPRWIVLAG